MTSSASQVPPANRIKTACIRCRQPRRDLWHAVLWAYSSCPCVKLAGSEGDMRTVRLRVAWIPKPHPLQLAPLGVPGVGNRAVGCRWEQREDRSRNDAIRDVARTGRPIRAGVRPTVASIPYILFSSHLSECRFQRPCCHCCDSSPSAFFRVRDSSSRSRRRRAICASDSFHHESAKETTRQIAHPRDGCLIPASPRHY